MPLLMKSGLGLWIAIFCLLNGKILKSKTLRIGLLLPFSGKRPVGKNAAGAVTLALER